MKSLVLLTLCLALAYAQDYTEPGCDGKQVIVHLFEWKWNDIAQECIDVLGPKQFCGVQVSPPMEHIQGGQWWTRYQPVSYKLESRSGSREEFESMVQTCSSVGVNIYVDLVINHMTGQGSGSGTGGSSYSGPSNDYPGVPYSVLDFHPRCDINDYYNPDEVRDCMLVGLNDLDQGNEYVQDRIAEYANDMIAMGVKGFRVDASKHMRPNELEMVQAKFNDVSGGGRPFVYHEVINHGDEPITTDQYFSVGKATEFRVCDKVSCIRGNDFGCFDGYSSGWTDGLHALVFVDNHDNQRGHGGAGGVLTHMEDYPYKLATAYVLAHEYGMKRIMSSYRFSDSDQGPPSSAPCSADWACEHRWSTIGNMAQFANAVAGESIEKYQNFGNSLGFARGSKGFVAMGDLNNVYFDTGLPDGDYCDIIHDCEQTITVSNGGATFNKAQANDPVVAICVGCTAL